MKNSHFLLINPAQNINKVFLGAFIGEIDGKKATSMKEFHDQIGNALAFPDYAGKNLDALDELINDLEWIKQEKVIIYISNSTEWLSKEKGEERILTILDIFDATAEDWKWMDDDDDTPKKELLIVFSDSERIRTLLEEQEIKFGMVE